MRHPWHALTRLLTADPGGPAEAGQPVGDVELAEAWAEAAARMGLVRLAWWSDPLQAEPDLVYPGLRAALRNYPRAERSTRTATSACGGEEEQAVVVDGSVLIAATAPGGMPAQSVLSELATLALAVRRRQELLHERTRAQARLAQAHATAAAGHDLRNELTRALLFAGRGQDGDAGEVVRALGAARDLAQSALLPPTDETTGRAAELVTLDLVNLRTAVTEEVRAAAAAARAPEGMTPAVRLKCPKRLQVLVHERTFRRALRNVALNAMEATARRAAAASDVPGAVIVRAERMSERTTSGYGVRLIVEDGGVGMGAREVGRFLDPRGSAESTGAAVDTGGKPASTGLGTASLALALSSSSIPLRVVSQPGSGTSLTFWLREILDPRAPVPLVVDSDPRRAARRVAALRERFGDGWAVLTEAAAAPLIRTDYVRSFQD